MRRVAGAMAALSWAGAAVAQTSAPIDQIVVTGSHIRGKVQARLATPIEVLGRKQIDAIGAVDIADIAQTLTVNNGAQNNPDTFTQNLTTGTSNINLRGLGLSSTLVLLNGKRQVNAATATDNGLLFVDTASLIPMIAIERIEIFKGGAAALYGSDAVGGVVNVIGREDFSGIELRADLQTNTDDSQTDLRLAGLMGGGDEDTHLTLAASYLHRSMLTTREKDLRPPAFRGPGGLTVTGSTLTSFPGNLIPLTAPDRMRAPEITPIANLFDSVADNATPLFRFDGIGTVPGTPVLADPSGSGFLIGSFAGFRQQNDSVHDPSDPNSTLASADGVQDAFTATVLAQALSRTPGLVADRLAAGLDGLPPALQPLLADTVARLPGFDQSSLSPAQQAMLQSTLSGLAENVDRLSQAGVFTPFVVPDPACGTFAAIDEDVFAPEPVIDPVSGQPASVGPCQFDFAPFFALVPRERRIQGYAALRHEFSTETEIYGEFAFARNRAVRNTSSLPTAEPLQIQPDNPFNPLPGATSILVSRSPGFNQVDNFFTDRPNPNFFEYDTFRLVAGVRGELVSRWNYDVSFLHATSNYEFANTDGLAAQTNLALNGFGGVGCNPATDLPGTGDCRFFNPFGSGVLADPETRVPVQGADGSPLMDAAGRPVTAQVLNSADILEFVIGDIGIDADSDLTVVDAVVSGDLFTWPAGPLSVALGFQYRDVELAQDFDANVERGNFLFITEPTRDFSGARDVFAVFGEADVPLTEKIDLSLALRYEEYGAPVGDTLDPRLGLLYRPAEWLSLRGAVSTSFRAPSGFQQFGTQTSLNAVIDPRNPTNQPFTIIVTDGREGLQPEAATAYNMGFSTTPLPGIELDFDWWHIDFDDIVIREQPENVVRRALCGPGGPCQTADPAFDPTLLERGIVRLGPTGSLSFVRTDFVNAAGIETNGFDASISYVLEMKLGTVRLGWEGTYINRYAAPVGPGRSMRDVADSRNSNNFAAPVPDFRFNADLGFQRGGHGIRVFLRYIDGFRDDQNCGNSRARDTLVAPDPVFLTCPDGHGFAKIASQTTVDMQYTYHFGKSGPLAGSTVSLGGINLFDSNPPFVATDGAFESRTHDPRGRMVYLRLVSQF